MVTLGVTPASDVLSDLSTVTAWGHRGDGHRATAGGRPSPGGPQPGPVPMQDLAIGPTNYMCTYVIPPDWSIDRTQNIGYGPGPSNLTQACNNKNIKPQAQTRKTRRTQCLQCVGPGPARCSCLMASALGASDLGLSAHHGLSKQHTRKYFASCTKESFSIARLLSLASCFK